MNERELIRWIRSQLHADPAVVPVGPGDDCAIVAAGGQRLLVTTDQVLDGVHFILAEHGPAAAGRKAMARNLSDIAAMAAAPLAAVVTAALPRGMGEADCKALYTGMRQIAEQFHCPIVGGDISAWDQPLAVSVTLLGRPWDGIEPVLRGGARAGDVVCVTGPLGRAWRTRHHLDFTPRVAEAKALAAAATLHAMIDISDGLAADLGHICDESHVAAILDAAAIPLREGADLAAALGDGEDYELLFTLSAADAELLLAVPPTGVSITRIGTIAAGSGVKIRDAAGERSLEQGGWEHRT